MRRTPFASLTPAPPNVSCVVFDHLAPSGPSPQDKAIVLLKYFEDKTLEEIAEIFDENVNTVKSRLYRSLKKLRGVLSA